MARFDVHPASEGPGFLLDVQADLLDNLNTRVVVPLLPATDAPAPATRLNPVFKVESEPHVMVTQFLSAVPCAILAAPIAGLSSHDTEIMAALDMLLTGI
jgi:toxin CcdB